MNWKSIWMLIALIGIAAWAEAATVNAIWTANTEADLAGYNIYQAPGVCAPTGSFVKVATFAKPATTGSVTVAADGTYCFKLTAFDTANNESAFSTGAQAVVNLNPPAAPANLQILSVSP